MFLLLCWGGKGVRPANDTHCSLTFEMPVMACEQPKAERFVYGIEENIGLMNNYCLFDTFPPLNPACPHINNIVNQWMS